MTFPSPSMFSWPWQFLVAPVRILYNGPQRGFAKCFSHLTGTMRFWEDAKLPSYGDSLWEGPWNPQDITGGVTLHHLLEVLSARFLCYVTISPFLIHTLVFASEWITNSYPAGQGEEIISPWRVGRGGSVYQIWNYTVMKSRITAFAPRMWSFNAQRMMTRPSFIQRTCLLKVSSSLESHATESRFLPDTELYVLLGKSHLASYMRSDISLSNYQRMWGRIRNERVCQK